MEKLIANLSRPIEPAFNLLQKTLKDV